MSVSKGFTLLELMIAILIFAMISTAAYKLFDSVTRAQQVTDGLLDDLDEMQRGQVTIEKDLLQMASRPVRNEFADKEAAVFGPSKNGFLMEFTRAGWRNPLNSTRSDLQRVAYAFEEGELVRYYWPVLDRAPDPVLIRQTLMGDVRSVRIRFMDEKKMWRSSWPPFTEKRVNDDKKDSKQPVMMPAGVEIAIKHDIYGLLEFTVPLITFKLGEGEADDKENREKGDKKRQKRNRSSHDDEYEEDDGE